MSALPVFSESHRCSKCGCTDVKVLYHRGVHSSVCPLKDTSDIAWQRPLCCEFEHIDRRCTRCGFAWAEACADAEPDAGGVADEVGPQGFSGDL